MPAARLEVCEESSYGRAEVGVNKRIVIGVVGVLLGIAVIGGIAVAVGGLGDDRTVGAISADKRSYVTKRWAVELNGVDVGVVRNVEGCGVGANVVKEQADPSGVIRKHISNPVYDACVIQIGNDMSKELFDWISAMLNRQQSAKNLSIIAADYDYKERSRTNLTNAFLTKVKFPALDGSSKDAAYLELTIQPEVAQTLKGSGASVKGGTVSAKASKAWLASNFRLKLGGAELPRTRRISAFEVTQELVDDSSGISKLASKAPGTLQLSDLSFAVSVADSAVVDQWFDDFVIKGNNAATYERSATIEYLTPSMKDVVATLSLDGLGIYKVSDESGLVGKDSVATKTYHVYVEQASFALGPAAAPPAPAPTPTPPPPPSTTTTTPPPPPAPVSTAAQGQIQVPAALYLVDGESFTLSDGVNPPMVFEFDSNGVAKNVPIRIGKEESAAKVATLVTETVNGIARGLDITAKYSPETAVVTLVNDNVGVQGNILISDTVLAKGFLVKGMSGGTGDAKPTLAVPTGLKAAPGLGAGEIDLSWEPTLGAQSYVVLMKTDPERAYRELEESKETTLTIGGLKSGAVHYFVIYAVHESGDSANSNEASATAP